MKIGHVVQKYGIPVNRLYFYINNGLLVPPKRNNQYIFDEHTIEELEWIIELKEMQFPLKTIHRLLSLRRISNYCSEEDQIELRNIYLEHSKSLLQKEKDFCSARQKVLQQLSVREKRTERVSQTGVPVDMLNLLCCPGCGGELVLENVTMNQKYIFQAVLHCSCGYSAMIQDGILQTPYKNQSLYDKPDINRELYRDLPSMTLSLFERSYRWLEEQIRRIPHGNVWLECYVNAWFFFHNHLELLNKEDSLIVLDKFPETISAYKAVIERQGTPCNILYISDASGTPPLRHNIIDCNMDFFASNEHNFYADNFFLSQLCPYLKKNCQAYGVYFFFQNGTRSMKKLQHDYPETFEENFNIRWFLQNLEKYFQLCDTDDCGFSLDSGENLGLGFHCPGEELHLQPYAAKLRAKEKNLI